MQQINTEYIDINLLIEDEINYNIHDDKHIKNMSLSIKDHGYDAIVLNKDFKKDNKYIIITGNGRFLACQYLKHKLVKVEFRDFIDESDIRRHQIEHNALSRETRFDNDNLIKHQKIIQLNQDVYYKHIEIDLSSIKPIKLEVMNKIIAMDNLSQLRDIGVNLDRTKNNAWEGDLQSKFDRIPEYDPNAIKRDKIIIE